MSSELIVIPDHHIYLLEHIQLTLFFLMLPCLHWSLLVYLQLHLLCSHWLCLNGNLFFLLHILLTADFKKCHVPWPHLTFLPWILFVGMPVPQLVNPWHWPFKKVFAYVCTWTIASLPVATVHDTENLTFSADDHVDNPHIAARLSAYVRMDNQRIPRGHLENSARTISRFRAEQLVDSVRNSADVRQKLPKVKTYCLHS